MKIGMTAVLPAAGFNDEHTCMRKVITPMLRSIRKQLRDQAENDGCDYRISILVDTQALEKADLVGKAVQATLNG
jgi:hypothetical protein